MDIKQPEMLGVLLMTTEIVWDLAARNGGEFILDAVGLKALQYNNQAAKSWGKF